jgi:hypothetical protein
VHSVVAESHRNRTERDEEKHEGDHHGARHHPDPEADDHNAPDPHADSGYQHIHLKPQDSPFVDKQHGKYALNIATARANNVPVEQRHDQKQNMTTLELLEPPGQPR